MNGIPYLTYLSISLCPFEKWTPSELIKILRDSSRCSSLQRGLLFNNLVNNKLSIQEAYDKYVLPMIDIQTRIKTELANGLHCDDSKLNDEENEVYYDCMSSYADVLGAAVLMLPFS